MSPNDSIKKGRDLNAVDENHSSDSGVSLLNIMPEGYEITNEEESPSIVEVDSNGLKDQMKSVKKFRIVQEIIANSFDEDSVNAIECTISKLGRGRVKVTVKDDGDGFVDYKDIFTMYAKSYKRTDVTKRGRYNLGEKQFFVLAEVGLARTGKTQVVFSKEGRKIQWLDKKYKGTLVEGIFSWNSEDAEEVVTKLQKLIIPRGKTLKINEKSIEAKKFYRTVKGSLFTEIADHENVMQKVKRETEINLYEREDGVASYIFELGVPVQKVKASMPWHIDVRQKIPLTTSRDVVSNAYLEDVYAIILEHTIDDIPESETGSKWIQSAMDKVDTRTARQVLEKQYGTDKLAFKSADPNENQAAIEAGFKLVGNGQFDGATRRHLEEQGLVKYASKQFASNSKASAEAVEPTDKMAWYAEVVKTVGREVLRNEMEVMFVASDFEGQAWFDSSMGIPTMVYNTRRLGQGFFDEFTEEGVGLVVYGLACNKEVVNDFGMYSRSFIAEVQRIAGIVGKFGIRHYIGLAKGGLMA